MTSGSPPIGPVADYLALDPVHANLRTRSVRSGLIAIGGRMLQGVINLGAVVVLARLLEPADFGVVAMVMPVTTVVTMTMNFGLHYAVMHEERLTPAHVNRLFWMALRFNVLLLGAMAVLGPVLAWLYREPRVAMVAAVWAVSLLIQSLGAFPEALLKRQLRFGALTVVQLTGMLAGAIAAIVAAASGAAHFALVVQFLVWDSARLAGALIVCRWRPGRPVAGVADDPVVQRLVAYGRNFALYRSVFWIGRQADRMVVGYVAGAAAAGLYDGARRWSWYPFHESFQSVTDVMVTTLSRARSDVDRFREFSRQGLMAFLILPMAAIGFVLIEADAAVRVLLGPRWLEAIPLVRVMCAAAFFDALGRITMWIYTSEGRTRQQFHWSLMTTPVMLAAIALGAARGVDGVAWAFAGSTMVLTIPTVAFCLRGSALRWRDFIALSWRPVLTTLAAGLLLAWMRQALPPLPLIPGFVLHGVVYAASFVLAWLLLPGALPVTRALLAGARSAIGKAAR